MRKALLYVANTRKYNVYGKIFLGVNLELEDEDGILKLHGSKGKIYNRHGDLVMWFGLIDENPDVFGLRLETPATQVSVTDQEGFAIKRKKSDGTWEKSFWIDPFDSTLYIRQVVTEKLRIVDNIGQEILNAEQRLFNVSLFDDILLDGKLTSLEKVQVQKEWDRVKQNYVTLSHQAEQYKKSTRNDLVLIDTDDFDMAKSSLDAYLAPLLANMEETTEVDRVEFSLKFKNYWDEADKIRNAIEDSIKYSSLQVGEWYNNVVMDETNGLLVIRSDMKYRAYLNATHGLALEKNENGTWVKKLYASIGDSEIADGTLITEDMVAKRLKIVDGDLGDNIILDYADGITINGVHGEQIRLNANEGFTIAYKDIPTDSYDKRLWIDTDGTIYAKKIVTEKLKVVDDLKQEILNSSNKYINLGTMNTIALDGKLTSIEKQTLKSEWETIKSNYTILHAQATKYQTSSRDNKVLIILTSFENAKNALESYLTPLLANMDETSEVDRVEFEGKFKTYYAEESKIRNAIEDALKYASLQVGEWYNNVMMDATNGFLAVRSDGKYRAYLNATHGLALEKYENNTWTKKLYATLGVAGYTDGTLVAEDLVAKRLKIIDGNLGTAISMDANSGITINGTEGKKILLNANDGMRVQVNGENRLWISSDGTLRARKLIIEPDGGDSDIVLDPETSGFISDLTVNSVKTISSNNPQDYFQLKHDYFRMVCMQGAGNPVETFKMVGNGTSYRGLTMYFNTTGTNRGVISKNSDDFSMYITDSSGGNQGVRFGWNGRNDTTLYGTGSVEMQIGQSTSPSSYVRVINGGVRIQANGSNYIDITTSGVKVVGSRIDLN